MFKSLWRSALIAGFLIAALYLSTMAAFASAYQDAHQRGPGTSKDAKWIEKSTKVGKIPVELPISPTVTTAGELIISEC